MPVFYNKVQKKNPAKPQEPAKWYPAVHSLGMVKEKEVAKLIAEETTLNPKEAEMALAQFEKVLVHSLLAGQTVQLGDWGSFRLTINAESSDVEADVNANKIKKVNIRFAPGKSLKQAMEAAEFKAADQLSK